jgi:methyl-accepting chemotaxis protein
MALISWLRGVKVKFWHKIALVCLVFGIPLGVLLYLYTAEQNKPIAFAQKELYGTEFLRPCRNLMEHVIQHQMLPRRQSNNVEAGELTKKALAVEADIAALEALDKKYGELMSQEGRTTQDNLAAIKSKWQDIRRQSNSSPKRADEMYIALIGNIRELISLIGDTSNLILDPDLDTYYLMDAVLLKQPEIQSQLAQLMDDSGKIFGKKGLTGEQKTEFVVRSVQLRSVNDNLNSPLVGMRVAFKNDSTPQKSLQPTLEPYLAASIAATNAYLELIKKKVIDASTPELTPEENNAVGMAALEANFRLWDEAVKALDFLLNKRIDGFKRNRNFALIGVGLAVMLAMGLVVVVVRGVIRQITALKDMFFQLGIGNMQARAAVVSRDELGEITSELNALNDSILPLVQSRDERDRIQESIEKLQREVAAVAQGDLTKEAEVTADITGPIATSINGMCEQLRKLISDVLEATLRVSSSANEIYATTNHLAQGSEAQAEQIVNTSAAIDEMAVSVHQVSENAASSAQVAQQALANAKQGNRAVQNTIGGMNHIRDQVQETAKRIKRLGESSQEIGQIIQLIDDIADRTSILALNASIQAAMAGEAGRGFAVVAEEVERLAMRSTDATKKIASLVKTIQSETSEAVAAMEKSINEVVNGSKLANEAGQSLAEIEGVSVQLAELIQSISLASKQQARGAEVLAKSMSEISQITQQTAAGAKQAAVSVSELTIQAENLRKSVTSFKLPGTNGQPAHRETDSNGRAAQHDSNRLSAPQQGNLVRV